MTETVALCSLTEKRVIVERVRQITADGVVYQAQTPLRRVYYNAPYDRELMQKELSEPYLSAVLAVFGETPLLTDASVQEETDEAV